MADADADRVLNRGASTADINDILRNPLVHPSEVRPTLPPLPPFWHVRGQGEISRPAPRPTDWAVSSGLADSLDPLTPTWQAPRHLLDSAAAAREQRWGPALEDLLYGMAALPRVKLGGKGSGKGGGKGEAGGPAGAGTQEGGVSGRGELPGGDGGLSAPGGSGDKYTPILGQPRTVKLPGHGEIEARPIPAVEEARREYIKARGLPDKEIVSFPTFDPVNAKRIAEAYDAMKHDPANPAVRAAYDAMIEDSLAQYRPISSKIDAIFNKPGDDPYRLSPALGYLDVLRNHRLSIFPTLEGYGADVGLSRADVRNNPLLQDTGLMWHGKPVLANDLFRYIHDIYGHLGPGNPFFRAPGEDRAFWHHQSMYSPKAIPAMASETRGQNSWVNFGPRAEQNKGASGADTVYADQKTGVLPDWVWREGEAAGAPVIRVRKP